MSNENNKESNPDSSSVKSSFPLKITLVHALHEKVKIIITSIKGNPIFKLESHTLGYAQVCQEFEVVSSSK